MVAVMWQIAPIMLFVALGYGFKRVKRDISKELVEFVMFFSLPAIAIVQINKLEFDASISGMLWIAYGALGLSLVVSFVAGKLMGLGRKDLATLMLVCSFGNTSFVGLSYIEALYSSEEVIYGLMYDQLVTFIGLLTVGVVLISWGGGHGERPKALAKKIVFSPPLLAIMVAIIVRDMAIPAPLLSVLEKLELTLIPLVTIVVGMKLEFRTMFQNFHHSAMVLGLKLAVIPLLVFGVVYPFVDMSQTWVKVTLLEVAMPTMTMATVFAIEGGLNRHLAINALGLGIVASFVSIPLWNYFLHLW
ncbi:AEC family transporter [Sulfurospirillum sp. T05]|uniref:AEC family transporter n=1 Tax=Sulfurospirillum tamanense TaxID=2813362 RepID=A0ABS2WR89_9BACT|nr:AEC family transporter [Sulfurospirillum tamanensis]MBN2963908.1 AEC family transporter [Sulfurospirillum tamanensis]